MLSTTFSRLEIDRSRARRESIREDHLDDDARTRKRRNRGLSQDGRFEQTLTGIMRDHRGDNATLEHLDSPQRQRPRHEEGEYTLRQYTMESQDNGNENDKEDKEFEKTVGGMKDWIDDMRTKKRIVIKYNLR